MMIKTLSGVELGGAVSSPSTGESIPYIAEGTSVQVEFSFECNLNPGTYFLNAGVTGARGDSETYLHRLLDAYLFRVLPVSRNTATGIVDFKCTSDIKYES
ncbi:hypothetical protein D3C78_1476760 [compost metagenome]